MEINYYLRNSLISDLVSKLQETSWLPDGFRVSSCDVAVLENFKISVGTGIDIIKYLDTKPHRSPSVLITDERFLGFKQMLIYDGKVLSLSWVGTNEEKSMLLPQMALGIIWWQLRANYQCPHDQCGLNPLSTSIDMSICPVCQEKISHNREHAINLLRYYSISCVTKNQHLRDVLNNPLQNVLFDLLPDITNSLLRVIASRFVVDYKLRPNTEIREWLDQKSYTVDDQKSKIKERYISSENAFPKKPFFIASRRWNSWTPNQPQKIQNIYFSNKGGGYLVSDGNTVIAIDPGYGFLEILYSQHKITVIDIDAIIITHDHPDHASELQNILGLRFVYEEECPRKLRIYLNPSTFYIFERTLLYHSSILAGNTPKKIHPGDSFQVEDIIIHTKGMYHDEIYHKLRGRAKTIVTKNIAHSESLGLKIELPHSLGNVKVAIPGDTSFPQDPEQTCKLAGFYEDIDVLSLHIGSLEGFYKKTDEIQASKVLYRDRGHLGLNGVVSFLNLTQPKVTILSEFGEELDEVDMRLSVTELVKDFLLRSDTKIIPSDIKLFLAFKKEEIYFKCKCGCFVPINKINFEKNAYNLLEYSFASGCESKLSHYDFK